MSVNWLLGRRFLVATIALLVGATSTLVAPAVASAASGAASLQVNWVGGTPDAGHGQTFSWVVTASNQGTAPTAKPVVITLAYDQGTFDPTVPGDPQAYGNVAVTSPKKDCSVSTVVRAAKCTVGVLQPGASTSMTVTGIAQLGTKEVDNIQWTVSVDNDPADPYKRPISDSSEYSTSPTKGHWDTATVVPTGIAVTGWVYDKTSKTGEMNVGAFIDKDSYPGPAVGFSRPDVNRALGVKGDFGFDGVVPLNGRTGTMQLCLVGFGYGTAYLLGCRTIVVP